MTAYKDMTLDQRRAEYAALQTAFADLKAQGLKLDMTRGKPCKDQLDMVSDIFDMLKEPEDYIVDGIDIRNYGALSGLLIGTLQHSLEAVTCSGFKGVFSIFHFPFGYVGFDAFLQLSFTGIVPSVEVYTKDRILQPVLFKARDCQSVEKFFPPLKVTGERTYQQAFPESAGTAQEID